MRGDTVRLYKFYPPETAKLNLQSRRLKLSLISELNDPFEMEPFRLVDASDRALWNKIKTKISTVVGLISFCDNWHNPVMWTHYAKEHTGLCLGFDVRRDLAEKVQYRKERRVLQSVRAFIERQDEAAMRFALTSKFSYWEYEQEYRIFCRLSEASADQGMYFEPFSGDVKLKEVVIGINSVFSSADIEEMSGRGVRVITARKAFLDFRICKQQDARSRK